jgi:hypothetical protein
MTPGIRKKKRFRMAVPGALMMFLGCVEMFAAVLRVGPDKPFKTVRAAAQAAQNGDTVEIDSGVYSQDVATWRSSGLTVRGVGSGRAHMRADGVNEGGKGIWVVQGVNFAVENVEFSGAAVPDRNGAGIRAEAAGSIVIRNCYFHDDEMGILSSNDPDAEVVIEDSIFEYNGFGDGYSHNMYIGRIRSFRLQCSYSHLARAGHNVKSRARQNYILYNRIMDEDDGTSSYQVDLPEGGLSFLVGNVIQKGKNAQNPSVIAYAAENTNAGTQELYAVNNTVVNGRGGNGTFFQLRAGTKAVIVNNILYGPGAPWTTAGTTVTAEHNYIESSLNNSPRLMDPANFDYRLQPDSPCRDAGAQPGLVNGFSLVPQSQYVKDARCEVRPVTGTIDIGAYEIQGAFPDRLYFPHFAVGGGYSTVFTLVNVGESSAAGNLILTDDDGGPGTTSPLSIPPGAVRIVRETASIEGGPVKKGWARVESAGGSLQGSAAFRLTAGGKLEAAVGVIGSQSVVFAAIPVDNEDREARYTGFALANPGDQEIEVALTVLDESGRVVDQINPADMNPLGPREQVARFLHEYLPARSNFRGSLQLREKSGRSFIIVSLLQNQSRYTALPILPAPSK